jgi:uncharacterized protein (DUF934 family)
MTLPLWKGKYGKAVGVVLMKQGSSMMRIGEDSLAFVASAYKNESLFIQS